MLLLNFVKKVKLCLHFGILKYSAREELTTLVYVNIYNLIALLVITVKYYYSKKYKVYPY